MRLIQCFQRNSTWYRGALRNGIPVGVLWHDTAGGNPTLKRYVQPHESDPDYAAKIALLGKNLYSNDWNHIVHEGGLNAWIGQLADGTIATVQTGEWNIHAWGCGGDSAGSCNGYIKTNGVTKWVDKFWIQFEICDDGYKDKTYFDKVYKEACEFTAYICKQFGIDPKGTVNFAGMQVPTILCHADSYKLKLGCNHGDVYLWFNKFGKTMDDVRNDVAKLMGTPEIKKEEAKPNFGILDIVKIKEGVSRYTNGAYIASFVLSARLYVREIRKDGTIIISTLKTGAITGVVKAEDLMLVEKAKATDCKPPPEEQENQQDTENNVSDAPETLQVDAGEELQASTEQEPVEQSTPSDVPQIAMNDVCPKEQEDIKSEHQYINTPEEAQNFAVKLLNVIIEFIFKVFGKR